MSVEESVVSVPESLARGTRAPADQLSKRLFDIVFAALLIFFLSPLLLAIATIAWVECGTVLFGHRRVGANGEEFICWKFRTMVDNADKLLDRLFIADPAARAEWERDFKLKNDPRLTRTGKLLRVTSLDELPQLFNVLIGEMSLVGPRPIVAAEINRYGVTFDDYVQCRPGITGVWQTSGRNNVDYRERVRLDAIYVRDWSMQGDIMLLLKTPLVVLRRIGAY